MTRIERPGPDAAAELSHFANLAFTDTFGHIYAPDDLAAFLADWNPPARLAEQFDDPDWPCALIRDPGGTILGYVKLGPIDFDLPEGHSATDAIELHQLYVASAAKGTGIAAALMDWAIAEARSRARILYLSVFTENPRAQAFYRRYGFVDIGRNPFRVGNHIDEDRIWRLDL